MMNSHFRFRQFARRISASELHYLGKDNDNSASELHHLGKDNDNSASELHHLGKDNDNVVRYINFC